MKVKINSNGELEIQRRGHWKVQHCAKNHRHTCCDLCPLFGEPEISYDTIEGRNLTRTRLYLCEGQQFESLGAKGDIEDFRWEAKEEQDE